MQKTLLLTAPAGGASEGLQQLWANFNAKYLSEYDPARRLDDEIIRSILIGTIVDATAATGGQAAPTLVKVFRPEIGYREAFRRHLRVALPGLFDGRRALFPPIQGGQPVQKPSGKWKYDAPFIPESNPNREDWIVSLSGKIDWGNITEEISKRATAPLKAGPIRVQFGYHAAPHEGFGWSHTEDHWADIRNVGYSDQQTFLADVLGNFDEIWKQPNGKLLLIKHGKTQDVAVVQLDSYDGFYGLTTAFPERLTKDYSKKSKLIWSKNSVRQKKEVWDEGAPH